MKKTNETKVIVFANSANGHFDLASYEAYHNKNLQNYKYPIELIKKAMATLPDI